MTEFNQQFDDFQQWVRHASSWLTRHPQYNNTEHPDKRGWQGHHFTAVCFDTKGRRCRMGEDFQRARDEDAFPVRWVWPDQVCNLVLAAVTFCDASAPSKKRDDAEDTLSLIVKTYFG